MKIVLLSAYSAIHTVRWANGLCSRGHDVYLLSLHRHGDTLDPRVKLTLFPFPPPVGYYLNVLFVRYMLKKIKPDIVNAHYASGYGTLGRLCNFHPYVLSVWGSDVYDFPHDSTRNRQLIVKNLKSADMVCSTSHAMAKVTKELCPELQEICITPFGVDTETFCPADSGGGESTITIGTVKTLNRKYGVDILIRAFAEMRESVSWGDSALADRLRLLIVGEGADRDDLVQLADSTGIGDVAQFAGSVPYSKVPEYLNKIDIYAAFSRLDSESFGVAIIEASSCGVPVIVSDVDGPSEVVINGETGFIVQRENVEESAAALEKLVRDKGLRQQFGSGGRVHVQTLYDWEKSLDIMENVYERATQQ